MSGEPLPVVEAAHRAVAEALREMAAEWKNFADDPVECEGVAATTWRSAAGDVEEFADRVEKGEFNV